MAIQGVRLTTNFVTDERPKDWREGILHLFPNGGAPLFALTVGMRKKVATDPEFNWWDKKMPTQRIALTAIKLVDAVVITHAAGAAFNAGVKLGSILWVEESDELLFVDDASIGSTDTTTSVVPSYSGSTSVEVNTATAGVNPNLVVIGNVLEENSLPPSGVNFNPVKRTNFTQIFRDTMEMSRTARETRLRTGEQVREAKREVLELHSMAIERSFWHGLADDTQTINGNIARTMGGVGSQIAAANIRSFDGTDLGTTAGEVTWTVMEEVLELAFKFGASEKMCFLGDRAMLAIQQAVRRSKNASVNLAVGQKEFGMNVSRLISPFGTLVLKTHPLFNQITSAKSGGTQYFAKDTWMYILDMAEFTYRFLRNSDTQWEPKLQANGLDGMQSGYLTECSLELHHPDTHMLIKNMFKGVDDT